MQIPQAAEDPFALWTGTVAQKKGTRGPRAQESWTQPHGGAHLHASSS
jgi:hypothetical protein